MLKELTLLFPEGARHNKNSVSEICKIQGKAEGDDTVKVPHIHLDSCTLYNCLDVQCTSTGIPPSVADLDPHPNPHPHPDPDPYDFLGQPDPSIIKQKL
jgi:hypothetical protein